MEAFKIGRRLVTRLFPQIFQIEPFKILKIRILITTHFKSDVGWGRDLSTAWLFVGLYFAFRVSFLLFVITILKPKISNIWGVKKIIKKNTTFTFHFTMPVKSLVNRIGSTISFFQKKHKTRLFLYQ